VFTIDDYLPVSPGGRPFRFSNPGELNELWPILLEKTYAKLLGDYESSNGGWMATAFKVFTGNTPVEIRAGKPGAESEKTKHYAILKSGAADDHNGLTDGPVGAVLDSDKLFMVLQACVDSHYIVAGACFIDGPKDGPFDETVSKDTGLIGGHAYSILELYQEGKDKPRVVRCRNPWGRGEWTRAYSDSDTDKIRVAYLAGSKAGHKSVEDGAFWMPWEEFIKYFPVQHICKPTTDITSLELDPSESFGAVGPCVGLLQGFFEYWLLCAGTRHLWCSDGRTTMQFVQSAAGGEANSWNYQASSCCSDVGVVREDEGVVDPVDLV
jgi:hypothetical protein